MNGNDIKGFLEDVYNSFVLRDLSYIFGGSILLLTIAYSFISQDLSSITDWVFANGYRLLFLIVCSYFFGLISTDLYTNMPWVRMEPEEYSNTYYSTIHTMEMHISPSLMKKFDRFTFFEVAEYSLAGSSLVSVFVTIFALIFSKLSFGVGSKLIIILLVIHLTTYYNGKKIVDEEGKVLHDVLVNTGIHQETNTPTVQDGSSQA